VKKARGRGEFLIVVHTRVMVV